ncbi:MAG: triose-phosphate isomerase [Bacteroidia bacterium]|nr:triose-phosphate isomerase [Bacteroidia bacterium]MDW8158849.1 triose-phosphate isomerase [Bacteroidia bacterium]
MKPSLSRRNLVAGNWKMYYAPEKAQAWVEQYIQEYPTNAVFQIEIALHVPFPFITHMCNILSKYTPVQIGAQNVAFAYEGPYTGEVSASMLRAAGARYCIIGHSERRQLFYETDEQIVTKIELVQREEILPILCVGETAEERQANRTQKVITKQLELIFEKQEDLDLKYLTVAYEPVWAIGSGKPATPEQAQEIHAFIRELFRQECGPEMANRIAIIYGGSVNTENAGKFFEQPDIDGALVGGASLNGHSFFEIQQQLQQIKYPTPPLPN